MLLEKACSSNLYATTIFCQWIETTFWGIWALNAMPSPFLFGLFFAHCLVILKVVSHTHFCVCTFLQKSGDFRPYKWTSTTAWDFPIPQDILYHVSPSKLVLVDHRRTRHSHDSKNPWQLCKCHCLKEKCHKNWNMDEFYPTFLCFRAWCEAIIKA